jgi:hypothetical protein
MDLGTNAGQHKEGTGELRKTSEKTTFFFFFCGTGILSSGFCAYKAGASKEGLYCLSHTSSPFC